MLKYACDDNVPVNLNISKCILYIYVGSNTSTKEIDDLSETQDGIGRGRPSRDEGC